MLRHLPNLISLLRIALVLPLLWLIREGHYQDALLIALVAGLSDALDGFLARHFGWQSRLGGLLDPLADKLLLITALLALAMQGNLPAWLVLVVIARDLLIVVGALAYHCLIGRFEAAPTILSKVTTAAQIVLVLTELLRLSQLASVPPALLSALIALAAVLTVASGIHYIIIWSCRAARERREQST